MIESRTTYLNPAIVETLKSSWFSSERTLGNQHQELYVSSVPEDLDKKEFTIPLVAIAATCVSLSFFFTSLLLTSISIGSFGTLKLAWWAFSHKVGAVQRWSLWSDVQSICIVTSKLQGLKAKWVPFCYGVVVYGRVVGRWLCFLLQPYSYSLALVGCAVRTLATLLLKMTLSFALTSRRLDFRLSPFFPALFIHSSALFCMPPGFDSRHYDYY